MYIPSPAYVESWSDVRQTDERIGAAILGMAANASDAERIWLDPTDEEVVNVHAAVADADADADPEDLQWGVTTLAHALEVLP